MVDEQLRLDMMAALNKSEGMSDEEWAALFEKDE